MKIPFLVVSYDLAGKKLFSYEYHGVHTLPLFTDPIAVSGFVDAVSSVIDKKLETQLCTDAKLALRMFEAITVHYPNLMRVVINPTTPVRDDSRTSDNVSWIENFMDIDEILDWLRQSIGSGSNGVYRSSSS